MAARKDPLIPSTSAMDSREWPNLYDEAREMLEASILIYAFADLRRLADSKKLSDEAHRSILNLPMNVSDVLHVVDQNKGLLQKEFGGESVDLYFSAMSSIEESVRMSGVDAVTGEAVYHSSKVVIFDDENQDKELVYGVSVNTARKRVTVSFRGSVTVQDFMTDANAVQVAIANPVSGGGGGEGLPPTVGIHSGFKDYLYGSSRRLKQGEIGKCSKIMKRVSHLLNQNPGYSLYVTGHSLGGALATLFAFEAAADEGIPKPVTCISVASPKVGNLTFRRSFQALEKRGDLRCMRIANYKDLVTLLPDRGSFSCLYISCCQTHVFRHVGIELKLFPKKSHGLTRAADAERGYVSLLFRDWTKQLANAVHVTISLPVLCCGRTDFLSNHSCQEYMKRLLKDSGSLQRLQLNNVYLNPGSYKVTAE